MTGHLQSVFLLLVFFGLHATQVTAGLESLETARDGRQTLYGLVSPLDREGRNFYLQTRDGQIEIQLDADARIGLLFREHKILQMFKERKIVLTSVAQQHALPQEIYVKVHFRDWKSAQKALKDRKLQCGILYTTPLPDHLPTPNELWFSGRVAAFKPDHITPSKEVPVGGRVFTVSTSGHNHSEQIVGLFDASRIQPFVNEASVYGRMDGKVFRAADVLLHPIPDQTAKDDPKLPRCLFIGDSISGNYGESLRRALAGKLNVHHPPTNCGKSSKGNDMAKLWLGNFKTRGQHWDVISFNFGHWDAGNTKADYQANLESVILQLKETGAKLIWVTTCPVPNGYPPVGELKADGSAPGRTAGVMKKYLNPWALEVIQKRPEISICDQWQFVYDHREDLYKEWWTGQNVHFAGEGADALGRFLAEHVQKAMKKG